MSELKAVYAYTSKEVETVNCRADGNEYYLKSEADKVIAEKDAEIVKLKEQVHDYAQGLYVIQARAEKESRHDKYKRCLGIAALCFEKSYSTTLVKYDEKSGLLRNFYDWWGNRWLELAEEPTWAKFLQLIHKEAK